MMDKIKILQVNKMYYPVNGGIERVVRQIAEGLNSGVDMKVLACQTKGRSTFETINGVRVTKAGSLGVAFSMPVSPPFFTWFQRLKKDRDILHIHMPFPLADAAVCLFGFKGKVVLWWHSDIVKQKKLLVLYKPFLYRLLNRADMIITATRGHIDGSDYLPAYRDKCVVIPYGADPPPDGWNAPLKRQTEPGSKPVRFLFAGRLVYYKGCDVLLDAFALVPDAELTIVGDGPLRQELETQAANLGIADRVCFKGGVSDDELADEFAACDVFVLPSVAKSEAFGIVQIEAMSYGKPVINTNLPGGVPYVSLDNVTGLTVPPSDPDALAAAMRKLADNAGLRDKFGKAAYDRAREEFSTERMLRSVLEQYRLVLNTGEA